MHKKYALCNPQKAYEMIFFRYFYRIMACVTCQPSSIFF